MKKTRFILTFLCLTVLASSIHAQGLSGRVRNEAGDALENVTVTLYRKLNQWDYEWVQSVQTDGQGDYTHLIDEDGTYVLRFDPDDELYVSASWENSFWPYLSYADEITVTGGAVLTGYDINLPLAASFSGRVVDSQGDPISDAYVNAYRWDGAYWQHVSNGWTESDGTYSISGLLAGEYRVDFSHDDFLTEVWDNVSANGVWAGGDSIVLSQGELQTGIDAALEEGGVVVGVLLDKVGNPVVGMNVTVRYWNSTNGYWDWAGSATTDSFGAYEINNLRTESYRVVFQDYDGTYANQVYGNPISSTDSGTGQAVSVTAGETTTLPNVSVSRLGSVSGTVLAADGNLPVSGVKVYLIDGTSSSDVYAYGWLRGEATTDANGNFTIPRVLEGTYHAIATTNSITENLLSEWHDGTLYYALPGGEPVPGTATAITVDDGENVQGADFALDTGSRVAGVVTGPGGSGSGGATIEFRLNDSDFSFTLVTDENGAFDQDKIIPGTYFRKVSAYGLKDEWYDNVIHRDLATLYTIEPSADPAEVEVITLEAGQSPAYVMVQSDPAGAEVYYNFQPTGEVTPVRLDMGQIEGLGLASHVITLVKDGAVRPVPKRVTGIEAETVDVMFDLVGTASGSLSIDSNPSGATVYVDHVGSSEGITPVTVSNLEPGSHVVLLKKEGYLRPRPVLVWVEESQTTSIVLPLTPDTSPSLESHITSTPSGQDVLVDYLPTGEVTDVQLAVMDPASHAGSGWYSASHTVMLRSGNWIGTPRYVDPDAPDVDQELTYVTVTASAGANGVITPSGAIEVVDIGSNRTFTALPDSGYEIEDWRVDGVSQAVSIENFELGPIETDMTVEVVFAEIILPPEVTTAPQNKTVTVPNGATFEVAATGGGTLTYQWQHSTNGGGTWQNLDGEISDSFNTGATRTSQSGELYRVVVSNSSGSVTSSAASLTVNEPRSPMGGVVLTTRRPDFSWPSASGATWYQVWVTRNGQAYASQWVNGTTEWTPSTEWPGGSYSWWVQGWGPTVGFTPWSTEATFSIPVQTPGTLVMLSPQGAQESVPSTFRWNKDAQATWYRLWAGGDSTGTWVDQWFNLTGTGEASEMPATNQPLNASPSPTDPVGGVGSLPTFEWSGGKHTWWLRAWGPDGYGPWSGPTDFTVPYPENTWVRIYLSGGAGMVLDKWTNEGSFTPASSLQAGNYSWWMGVWEPTLGQTLWSDRTDFEVE